MEVYPVCSLQKDMRFDFALMPLTPDTGNGELFRAMQELRAGTWTYMLPAVANPPVDTSLFSVSGNCSVTALEPVWNTAGREVVMRLCAFDGTPGRADIRIQEPCDIYFAGLDLENRSPAAEKADVFSCNVPVNKIVTLIFDFN